MSEPAAEPVIRLRGVRHNNLKNFDLDLPVHRLIVVTGLSGSGKSSLAFDTLFAEGQRRYLETFSPYARQFFDRMDKPRVDSIDGIPPAVAIEQRNQVRTTRSTVGTMTEICDYLKVLWPHLAELHCRGCGRPVRKDTPAAIWETLRREYPGPNQEVIVTFTLELTEKMGLDECLSLIARQGYPRLMVDQQVVRVEDVAAHPPLGLRHITVVQDRVRLTDATRARFVEACEQGYHFGKGRITAHPCAPGASPSTPVPAGLPFSNRLHCAACNLEYREPFPALFSFNHPQGACPSCRGFGRIISIDYDLAIPDRTRTLAEGAVKPWQRGVSAECQDDLLKFCRACAVPTDVPFRQLTTAQQRWVLEGDPDYGIDDAHQWPQAWYGVKGYFRWLESKAYKMHVRVLLSRYRSYQKCPTCDGQRLQPDALLYLLRRPPASPSTAPSLDDPDTRARPPAPAVSAKWLSLADFYALPIADAVSLIDALWNEHRASRSRRGRGPHRATPDPIQVALDEVRSRLRYLLEVGLDYLTLDRPTRTLSGGETQRVHLTTCLGTRLVNTLFVLDEPSVGLHPRDTARLVRILENLRQAGNTVVVVEHEPAVMKAADQIVDLGPGHGETGGQVVFQGTYRDLLRHTTSLTGQYLAGRRRIDLPRRRPVRLPPMPALTGGSPPDNRCTPCLVMRHAQRHNLKDLSARIPLGRFVCLTGVSGSGKTTLLRDVLIPILERHLCAAASPTSVRHSPDRAQAEETDEMSAPGPSESATVEGWTPLRRLVVVDQAALARTPRSTPAVYVGAFDEIRRLFAASEEATRRELNPSAFSFNSRAGQCERCRGAGFEKIEMQFLSDVYIRCPDCDGTRYRPHVLEVRLASAPEGERARGARRASPAPRWSIADVLGATVDDAMTWLAGFAGVSAAAAALERLRPLQEVGLGYLRLGQPINTLSGGESQRLKLAAHLRVQTGGVPVSEPEEADPDTDRTPSEATLASEPSLFVFDEPTTGLHFDDVRILLDVFQRLVDAGHSVLVIEHNLEVIKCADWVLDLGPEGGNGGGRLVAEGPPESIVACPASHTGAALRGLLARGN